MPVRRRFEDKRSRSEVISVRGEGSSRQQVLTLDKLLSRWGASARFSSDVASSSKPSIQVEGRGHGMAVVQLRTSYYTTSVRRLRQANSKRRVGFDLEPRVELGGKNNTTEFKILPCQR